MSSFDKIVKLACKPKAASPKAKVRWLLARGGQDIVELN
jgi:hypothetical protein